MPRAFPRLALACLMSVLGSVAARGNVAARLPESTLISGFAVGATTRSHEPRSLFETLEEVRRAGCEILEIHAGQAIGPGFGEARVGDTLTDEQLTLLRRKLSATSVKLVAAQVRFSNNNSANARLFEWADQLGIQILVGDPPLEQFDGL
ncbi:MAG: hypothetical protein IT580_07505, partial [Verrucomicrobiales bacterium]|nr:hypothetical protein [Verrucomicrobiales bacterium]